MPDLISEGAAALSQPDDDAIQPFMLDSSGLRGDLVRLGPIADHIVTRHAYPEPLAALLIELLTLTTMLASVIKFDGVFSLQTKGDGAVPMMVADMTSAGDLRGYLGFDADKLAVALARRQDVVAAEQASVPDLLGKGYLAFTVDQGAHTERYQGIVELDGFTLTDCVQHYFKQSEQIQTGLTLAVDKVDGAWRAGGIILQRMPKEGAERGVIEEEPEQEDWRRAMILQASCTARELLDPGLPMNDLLFRLFHEEGVRVFERRSLAARCRCSRERLVETLRSLPRDRVEEMKVDGAVAVTCEFCSQAYRFDSDELARIYVPDSG